MSIGAGLASQLGVATETTWGTRVAPQAYFEFESEGLVCTRNRIASRGLRAGRTFQSSSRRVTVTRTAGGPVTLEVPNQGFGKLLNLAHGNTVTPAQQASTDAYLQTHNLTGDPNKSATIQVGKPGTDGTVRCFEYAGSMLTDYQFSCESGGFLMWTGTFDSKDEDKAQTLGTASYPTGLEPFHFAQCTVSIDGNSITDRLTSFDLSGSLPRKTDRFHLGGAGVRSKPILNDYTSATVSFGGEFKDLALHNLYTGDDIVPVVVTFTSATEADSGHPFEIEFTMAACQLDAGTPTVDGPDVLAENIALTVLEDGTNPPVKITYMSTDTQV